MRKCLNCGAIYSDDALKFCDCGGPLVRIPQEQPEGVGDIDLQYNDLLLSQDYESQVEREISDGLKITEDEDFEVQELDFQRHVVDDDELEDVEGSFLDDSMLIEYSEKIPEVEPSNVIEEGLMNEEISESSENLEEDVESILREIFGLDEKMPEPTARMSSQDALDEESKDVGVWPSNISCDSNGLDRGQVVSTSIESAEVVPVQTSSISRKPIISGIKLTIYRSGLKVSEKDFWFDEILIGRSKSGVEVDVNLRDLDNERITSRKHAKIFKDDGKYFIQRVSQNAVVWVHGKFLEPGEVAQLYEGDRIILSNTIGLIVDNVQPMF
uniref:FHA domain-containing protein n=1 Tax=Fervidobacterium thailandense TaxID=1008305 RepID=A0A7C4RWG0_9BACT